MCPRSSMRPRWRLPPPAPQRLALSSISSSSQNFTALALLDGQSVALTWTPPPLQLRNGAIVTYFVTYAYNDARLSPSLGPLTTVAVAATAWNATGLPPCFPSPQASCHIPTTPSRWSLQQLLATRARLARWSSPQQQPPSVRMHACDLVCDMQDRPLHCRLRVATHHALETAPRAVPSLCHSDGCFQQPH